MAVLKIINHHYNKSGDIERLINYMINPQKMCGMYGSGLFYSGCNNIGKDIEEQFEIIRLLTARQNITKYACHFIISFHKYDEEYITPDNAMRIALYFAQSLFPTFQYFYTIHNTDSVHIHLVVSPVDCYGRLLCDKRETYEMMRVELAKWLNYKSKYYDKIKLVFSK